jgi:hypothetical protein
LLSHLAPEQFLGNRVGTGPTLNGWPTGLDVIFFQGNQSKFTQGVLYGLHYQIQHLQSINCFVQTSNVRLKYVTVQLLTKVTNYKFSLLQNLTAYRDKALR